MNRFLVLVFFILSSFAHGETVKLITFEYPPFLAKGKQGPEGFLVEIINEAAGSKGMKVEYTFQSFARASLYFRKQPDSIFLGGVRDFNEAEAKKLSYFESLPIYFHLLHKKELGDVNKGNLAKYAGKSGGYMNGSKNEKMVVASLGLTPKGFPNPKAGGVAVKSGKVDFFLCAALLCFLSEEENSEIKSTNQPVFDMGLAFFAHKKNAAYVKKLNALKDGIQKISANGKLKSLYQKYYKNHTLPNRLSI